MPHKLFEKSLTKNFIKLCYTQFLLLYFSEIV